MCPFACGEAQPLPRESGTCWRIYPARLRMRSWSSPRNLYVSTAEAFRAFDPGKVDRRPSVEGMKRHLEGSCLPGIAGEMVNVLETVTFPLHPQVAGWAKRMQELTCARSCRAAAPASSAFLLTSTGPEGRWPS